MEEIVRASDVRHVYPDGTVVHFRGPDLVVRRGERVGLLGPNGSGKSTLLFHLMGVLHPTGGTVRVFGHDPAREFHRIQGRLGVLLQDPDEQIIAPTVRDDVAFTPLNLGYPPDEVERMVQRVAEALDIAHLLDKVPHYLSGGERLKVALAGALVTRPLLLLLDEPAAGLSPGERELLAGLLLALDPGMTILLVEHDMDVAFRVARQVTVMHEGRVIAEGTPEEISADELVQQVYLGARHG